MQFCVIRGAMLALSTHIWIFCFLCLLVGVAGGMETTWSMWFDGEADIGVEDQTLDRIKELYRYDCPTRNVVEAECRVRGSLDVFSNTAWYQDNYLRIPCNRSGILCTLQDQIVMNLVSNCYDYEVRFLCATEEPSGTDTTVQNPLSINGGFIAMAAGLSVVIPLICVLIIQLRRAKREERERARVAAAASGGENGETQGPVNDPPPSYEQLFGPTHVSPVHSRNGSMDALIEENETGHSEEDRVRNAAARTAGASTDGVDGGGSRDDSQVPSATGPRSNPAFSSSSIATISGSQVTDDPVNVQHTQREASSERAPGSASLSNATSSSTQESNSRQSTSLSSSTPPPPYSASRPSSSSSSSSLSSAASTSTSSASRSGSSSPPPPPPPPPPPQTPPPPFPSWSRRSNPNAVNNRQSSGELSRIGQTLRRLPGMHISIEDFFASLRGLYDNENDGPPPSYEEALKILESAKIAKEQEIK